MFIYLNFKKSKKVVTTDYKSLQEEEKMFIFLAVMERSRHVWKDHHV